MIWKTTPLEKFHSLPVNQFFRLYSTYGVLNYMCFSKILTRRKLGSQCPSDVLTSFSYVFYGIKLEWALHVSKTVTTVCWCYAHLFITHTPASALE